MKIVDIKSKLPDTDKVTINLGLVDLAQMDLLVGEGFYTNRSDFVRMASHKSVAATCGGDPIDGRAQAICDWPAALFPLGFGARRSDRRASRNPRTRTSHH